MSSPSRAPEVSPFVARFLRYTNTDAGQFADAYPIVRTFSSAESGVLTSPGTSIWFDDTGILQYGTTQQCSASAVAVVPNTLTGSTAPVISCRNTSAQKWSREFPYIFSVPHGRYVLCRDLGTEVVTLRYNVVPRSDFVNYLLGVGKGDRSALIAMCALTSGRDPLCNCLAQENPFVDGKQSAQNFPHYESLTWGRAGQVTEGSDTEWCLNSLLGGPEFRRVLKQSSGYGPAYRSMIGTCDCSNVSCLKDHPVLAEVFRQKRECAMTQTTICGTQININGNVEDSTINAPQMCSSYMNAQDATPFTGSSGSSSIGGRGGGSGGGSGGSSESEPPLTQLTEKVAEAAGGLGWIEWVLIVLAVVALAVAINKYG